MLDVISEKNFAPTGINEPNGSGSYEQLFSRGIEAGWTQGIMLRVACEYIDDRIGSDEFGQYIFERIREEEDEASSSLSSDTM